ncbi:unnamed protein product, partial [Ixodes pacificus]
MSKFCIYMLYIYVFVYIYCCIYIYCIYMFRFPVHIKHKPCAFILSFATQYVLILNT